MARKVDAWRQPDLPAPTDEVDDLDDIDDEDEGKRCLICFELESTSRQKLFFIPCGHTACESCVQSLRREAVCKDVKGVMCPYCRQTIENYSTVKPSRPATKVRVERLPSPHLRNSRFILIAERGCPKGKPRVPAPFGWQGVTSIGGLNDYSPPPNVTGADGPGLKPNRSEENLLDNFQGMPIKPTDNLLSMAETVSGSKQLHYNLKHLGGKKQKNLFKSLLEATVPHARRLATHHCGNYTMQRMLAFASQHRSEQVNGESGFTAIVRSMCKDKSLPDISCHEKGTFVVQKMVACLGGPAELKLTMDSIEGKVAQMASNPNACFSLERIVEICIVCVSQPADRQPCTSASEATKYLCRIAVELCSTRDFVFKASQASNYATPSLLVECLRWSATEARTRALLLSLAKKSDEFAAMGKWGRRFLQGLLSIDIPEVAEAIVASFVGDPERPRTGLLASMTFDAKELFYSCAAAPCLSDECRDRIVRDFLLKAQDDHYFLKIPHVLQGFCFGLSLLPQKSVHDHVEILKALGAYSSSLLQTVKGMQKEYCLPFVEGQNQLRTSSQSLNDSQPPSRASSPAAPMTAAADTENFPPMAQPRRASAPAETSRNISCVSSAPASPASFPCQSESFPPLGSPATVHSAGKHFPRSARDLGCDEASEQPHGRPHGAPQYGEAGARRKLLMGGASGDSQKRAEGRELDTKTHLPAEPTMVPPGFQNHNSVNIPCSTAESETTRVQSIQKEVNAGRPMSNQPQGTAAVPLPVTCAQCHSASACMVIVQCRHLSTCKACSSELRFCPLCNMPAVDLLEVVAAPTHNFRTSPDQRISTLAPDQGTNPLTQNGALPVQPENLGPWVPAPTEAPTYNGGSMGISSGMAHMLAPSFRRPSPVPQLFGPSPPPSPFAPAYQQPNNEGGNFGAPFLMPGAVQGYGPGAAPMPAEMFPHPAPFAPNFGSGTAAFNPPLYQQNPRPPPQFLQGPGGSYLAPQPPPVEVPCFQPFQGNMIAHPNSPGDSFPDVNLSFLTMASGEGGASPAQVRHQLPMAPFDVGHLPHDLISDDSSKLAMRPRPAVRPAPYLPPGLF